MAVYNHRLYVADIDTLVEIDLQRGVIIKSHHAPGAVFLNDVAAASDGSIYVSDSRINKIFRLKKDRFTLWLEDSSFHRINGLYAEKKYLYAGSSLIQRIHRASKKITVMDTDCGGIDGLEKDKKGNFIFSNWAGLICYSHNGNHSCLLDLRREKINTADITFVKQSNLLLVPTFLDNRVIAYMLE
jgi:sugar lactone lactonase YvrE